MARKAIGEILAHAAGTYLMRLRTGVERLARRERVHGALLAKLERRAPRHTSRKGGA